MPSEGEVITIKLDELIPGRRAWRARAVGAGLSDDNIDRLIKQAQKGSRASWLDEYSWTPAGTFVWQ